MNDAPRPRRSPTVVLLDTMLNVVTAVQSGNLPGRRRPDDGTPPRRTGPYWLLAGVLGMIGGTVVLIVALLRSPGALTDLPAPGAAAPAPTVAVSLVPPVAVRQSPAGPSPSTSVTPSVPVSASAGAGPSASVPPSRTPSSAAAPRLAAAYAAANGSGLLGYRATVTLAASGGGPSADWRLTVTLPRSTLRISAVSGATAERDGAVWTLTPDDDTRTLAPGTTAVVTFDVLGATLVDAQPTDCRINDRACTGLPG